MIVVVDDCSPKEFELPDYECTLIRNKVNSGPANARNQGVNELIKQGVDLIFLTDSDCIPSNDWIESGKKKISQILSVIYCQEIQNLMDDALQVDTMKLMVL